MLSIEKLLDNYRKLEVSKILDFDKFSQFAIVHHSTHIEGSTLTLTETELLLSEGITPKGKPILHSLMEQDHYKALLYTLDLTNKKEEKFTVEELKKINALVMKNSGQILNTALGTVDATKGDFRKVNVTAGDTYFINYDKVESYTNKLIDRLNEEAKKLTSDIDRLTLSFQAHFDLVTIHPFLDGNGRTSRLLMNYFQQKFNLPLAIVFSEDKIDYIQALKDTREKEDFNIFKDFMFSQYRKLLEQEIKKSKSLKNTIIKKNKKGYSLIF